jgi:hypothetical protein
MSDNRPTETAASKIADGLRDAIEIIRRAKELDPPAWRDADSEEMRRRRFAAIHRANEEVKNG